MCCHFTPPARPYDIFRSSCRILTYNTTFCVDESHVVGEEICSPLSYLIYCKDLFFSLKFIVFGDENENLFVSFRSFQCIRVYLTRNSNFISLRGTLNRDCKSQTKFSTPLHSVRENPLQFKSNCRQGHAI